MIKNSENNLNREKQINFCQFVPPIFFILFVSGSIILSRFSINHALYKNTPHIIIEAGFIIGLLSFIILKLIIKQKNTIDSLSAKYDVMRLLETQKHLEQKIEERTKEYKDQKIIAEKAAKAKEEFLANMSHELRTPLNSIIGLTKIISEDNKLTNEQTEMIGIINKSSDTLLKTVNDILDISKIESGKTTINKKPFDLSDTLISIVEQIRPLAMQRGLEIQDNLSNISNIYIESDEHRITKIITNLAGNAVKYTKKGHVRLEFETNYHDDITEFTCKVSDTGIGIPKNKIDDIFDKFTQAQEPDEPDIESTGLGLSIVKQLVDLMLGSIEVESELGKGSTFTVTIPCPTSSKENVEEYKKNNSTNKKANHLSQKQSLLNNTKILIAEDHDFNKILIEKLVTRLGCNDFDIVTNGYKAVEAFEAQDYDLILMDCSMPELDGYNATRKIRDIEISNNIINSTPIIAMTADIMPGTKEKCLNCGMNDYISKPIHEDIFQKTVHKWLDKEHHINNYSKNHNYTESDLNSITDIDLSLIEEYADYNIETQKELIQIFYQKSLKDLRSISKSIINGKSNEWVDTAHALKGSAGYIGAKKLENLCDIAQSMIIETKENRQSIYQKIKSEHALVCKFLKNEELL